MDQATLSPRRYRTGPGESLKRTRVVGVIGTVFPSISKRTIALARGLPPSPVSLRRALHQAGPCQTSSSSSFNTERRPARTDREPLFAVATVSDVSGSHDGSLARFLSQASTAASVRGTRCRWLVAR
jgi:hypothetical protein